MKSSKPSITADTSALVKWFKVERDRAWALQLRSWAEEGRIKLILSVLFLSECARGFKKAGWENKEITEALDMFDMMVNLFGIELISVDKLVAKTAQKLVIEHGIYSADAIHAATAILTSSSYFVSSDKHHVKKSLQELMESKGVKVLKLAELREIETNL
jgi:predicted nucleic acid-binding protein